MLVTFFLLCGVSITLDVEPSDTIENVKAKIQERAGVPSKRIKIYYGGKNLNDGLLINQCGRAFAGLAYFIEGRCEWGRFFDSRPNGADDESLNIDDDRPNLMAINNYYARHTTEQKIYCFYSGMPVNE